MDPALAAQYEQDLQVNVPVKNLGVRELLVDAEFRMELERIFPSCRLLRPLHCQMRMMTCEGVKLEPSVRSLVL